jgi:glutathione S-transferase
MFKLYGFPASNYTNMVNLALLEKGVPFEYVLTYPGQGEALLAKSPRGKVPFLETPHGFINETSAILEYLEDQGAGTALLPEDPFLKAQVRALMKEIELYIELPARACFLEAIFGLTVPQAIKDKARGDLMAGFDTLKRHGRFSPYVAGDRFTLADIVFLYSVDLGAQVARKQFDRDPLADLPAARHLLQLLGEKPNVQVIASRRDAQTPGFIAAIRARYGSAAAANA